MQGAVVETSLTQVQHILERFTSYMERTFVIWRSNNFGNKKFS